MEKEKQGEEKIPAWQLFFDDFFLLFLLGITVPTVIYLVWGLFEFANAPIYSP